ncbi:MAG TPA: hypothetical protein VI461_11300 [Chitinophagaceae bacterium]|nr:hypothetical protein [Chitinophagaceae bacterium]
MKKSYLIILTAVSLFIVFISCSKDNPNNNDIDCSGVSPKTYSTDVDPIVQSTCNQQGCHDVASVNGPGPLTNYTQLFNARTAVREAIRTGLMPQNTTLTIAQRTAIICWIDNGAQNN